MEVTDTTLFGIASCSKAMTSAVIAMLVAEGKLDYDIPIINYIPDFTMMDEEATKKNDSPRYVVPQNGAWRA